MEAYRIRRPLGYGPYTIMEISRVPPRLASPEGFFLIFQELFGFSGVKAATKGSLT